MNSKELCDTWNCDKSVQPTTGSHFEEGYFCFVVCLLRKLELH